MVARALDVVTATPITVAKHSQSPFRHGGGLYGRRQSYLFYLPWLNHNANASFNLEDSTGVIGRGLIMISCNGTNLANGLAGGKPYIQTILRGANIPRSSEIPLIPTDKTTPTLTGCGPETE